MEIRIQARDNLYEEFHTLTTIKNGFYSVRLDTSGQEEIEITGEHKPTYKVIGIMGKSGSGKSTIIDRLHYIYPQLFKAQNKVNLPIEWTTRPLRKNDPLEKYHFVNRFNYDIVFLCRAGYYGHEYGIPLAEFDENKINIIILNRQYYEQLKNNENVDLTVIYLDVDEKVLEKRKLKRLAQCETIEEADEFIEVYKARIKQDEEDFKHVIPNLVLINDGEEDYYKIIREIDRLVKKYYKELEKTVNERFSKSNWS